MVWGLLAIGVVVALVFWMMKRGGSQDGRDGDETSGSAEEPLPEWVAHLESLVSLDLSLRQNALPEAVVTKLESIIDRLRELIPELNERHTGSELAWTVNRMSSDYLSRVMSPYIALVGAARGGQQDALLESLGGLESELDSIEELVKNNQEGEFKSKAAFLKARFLDDKL